MGKARSLRKRQLRQALRVPLWYWLLLAAIALVGGVLIAIGALGPRVRAGGLSDEGDYFLGRSDAPVTLYEWGNFT
ncbi:MAG: hypothetical protein ACP5OO_06280 [Chloroflexia bacterium]